MKNLPSTLGLEFYVQDIATFHLEMSFFIVQNLPDFFPVPLHVIFFFIFLFVDA